MMRHSRRQQLPHPVLSLDQEIGGSKSVAWEARDRSVFDNLVSENSFIKTSTFGREHPTASTISSWV